MQDRKIENSSKSDVCTEPILHHVTENGVEFEWWYELEKAFIYAGCKQICLSTGNDLATFRVSLTK